MSKLVFDLNSGDNADYLSFSRGEPEDVRGGGARSKAGRPKKQAAPRVVQNAPGVVDPQGEDDDYVPYIAPDDRVAPSAVRKIPIKSVQEHQLLINHLNAYLGSERFSPVLRDSGLNLKSLTTKSVAELRELKERVRACCANSGSSGGIVSAVTLGVCGRIEAWAPKKLIDLDGYREALARDDEFAALCEMIEIDSGFKSSMTPSQRMALCLATTALSVGSMNKVKAAGQAASQNLLAQLQFQQQQQQQQQQHQIDIEDAAARQRGVPSSSDASIPEEHQIHEMRGRAV